MKALFLAAALLAMPVIAQAAPWWAYNPASDDCEPLPVFAGTPAMKTPGDVIAGFQSLGAKPTIQTSDDDKGNLVAVIITGTAKNGNTFELFLFPNLMQCTVTLANMHLFYGEESTQ